MTESSSGMSLAESLLSESDRLIGEERFAVAVLTAAAALEAALAACAGAVLLSVVSKRSAPVEIEMLRKRYMHAFGSMSLPALRNVVITLVTRNVHPQTIAESLDFVEHAKRFAATAPAREHYDSIDGDGKRRTMEALRDCAAIALFQSVLHERRQPSHEEARQAKEAVADLTRSLAEVFVVAPS